MPSMPNPLEWKTLWVLGRYTLTPSSNPHEHLLQGLSTYWKHSPHFNPKIWCIGDNTVRAGTESIHLQLHNIQPYQQSSAFTSQCLQRYLRPKPAFLGWPELTAGALRSVRFSLHSRFIYGKGNIFGTVNGGVTDSSPDGCWISGMQLTNSDIAWN